MALYRCKRDTWELRQEGHHLVWSQLGADILDDSNFLGALCMSLNMWVNVGSIDFGVTNSSEQTKLQIWNPWIRVDCVCIYVYIIYIYIHTYMCVCIYIHIYVCMNTHTHTHIYIFHWRRQWQPIPVLLPGKAHGRRSLVGCSPWGHKESDTTERLHFSLSFIGEGNGNLLQCSCLENPRDGGAWWAARTCLRFFGLASPSLFFFFPPNISVNCLYIYPKQWLVVILDFIHSFECNYSSNVCWNTFSRLSQNQ